MNFNLNLYYYFLLELITFYFITGTEEEAAEAYDIAAIKFRGLNAVTNFDMSRYDVKAILESNTLPIGGGAAKRLKEAQALETSRKQEEMIALSSTFQYGTSSGSSSRLQLQANNYPLLMQQHHQQQHFELEQPQPLLTLQNHHDISQFSQDPSLSLHHDHHRHHSNNYMIQTQLELHQSAQNNNAQFYNGCYQNHPALLQGMMNMGPSSSSSSLSLMENNNNNATIVGGSSAGSYSGGGGFVGNNVGSAQELGLVKVDYDMPAAGGYGGWSAAESMQTSTAGGLFNMWNN